jgi:predicted phage terminase large subunit-like protein
LLLAEAIQKVSRAPESAITPQRAAQIVLDRRACRRKLARFVQKVFEYLNPDTEYHHNWHIDLICEYLEAVYRGELKRLIINIEPRSLKSTIVSVAWPAWVLGQNASAQFLCASYAAELSVKLSVDCRSVIESAWYRQIFPGVVLSKDQNEKSKFVTTEHGHRIATSVGGSAMGKGGLYLVLDDPIKREDAYSDAVRKATNDWIDQTFLNRLNDKKAGAVVMIMQRLHVDDPAGHLVKKGGPIPWTVLKIPTVAKADELIEYKGVRVERAAGDLLHPIREGQLEVDQMRIDLGSFGFAGQCQQDPVPLGGSLFKVEWWKRVPAVFGNRYLTIQTWDSAWEDTKTAAFSCCVQMTRTEFGIFIEWVTRKQMQYPELKNAMKDAFTASPVDGILIENKASGIAAIQELKRPDDYEHTSLPIISWPPEGMKMGSKLARAMANAPMIEAGQVFLVVGETGSEPWVADFIQEHADFPGADLKDQVDATSQGLSYLKDRTGVATAFALAGMSFGIGRTQTMDEGDQEL